ncbi:hypothetical protein AOQ84DRAFT_350895 [Glonium stellatum]|uniref:Uncharacterized protein n=1 Tax=Glonium stellatum TaxID=574774 RepID=A0A8E2EMA9_9PEZI|nr:hypothetical protein AOQ84DRAFT_350895 [Glonium stellatum]
MADALCGPSNALQNFQKHTTIDRTLQQDRLISRQSPSQGFRSGPGHNVGILDPEFEAFQAGHLGPPQPDFHHLPPHPSQAAPPPQFATPPPQVAGWASDFQRLHVSSPLPPTLQQNQQYRPQASASAWHQDFLTQQAPTAGPQTYQRPTRNTFGGNGYSMGGYAAQNFNQPQFGVPMHSQDMSVAQGKQRAQENAPQFDEAAFERAFEQAQAEILAEQEPISLHQSVTESKSISLPRETDPILLRIAEKRYPVYLSIKLQSLLRLKSEDALIYLPELENLEENGSLFNDLSEARWCLGALKNVLDADVVEDAKSRSSSLIEKINARLMSMYPLNALNSPLTDRNIWDDLKDAGYTVERPIQEPVQEEPQQEKKEQNQHHNDDDAMAETAARLLDSVADNTSDKFRQSTFLELMRRLRDREVRVEGDKVVETNGSAANPLPEAAARIPPHEQDADLGRSGVLGRDPGDAMHGREPDLGESRAFQ